MVQGQGQACLIFDFPVPGDERHARATRKEGNARMHLEQLQDLSGLPVKSWINKYQTQGNFWRREPGAQILRPGPQSRLVELPLPMPGH